MRTWKRVHAFMAKRVLRGQYLVLPNSPPGRPLPEGPPQAESGGRWGAYSVTNSTTVFSLIFKNSDDLKTK